MTATLSAALSVIWPGPMVHGFPDGTTFSHQVDDGCIWAWLSTPEEKHSFVRIEPEAWRTNEGLIHTIDERLRDLHDLHWDVLLCVPPDAVPVNPCAQRVSP